MAVELLTTVRFTLPQRDRETPQSWLDLGPVRWAVLNGSALGIGAGTRIGLWLWYAMPLIAAWRGDFVVGAAMFGSYGLSRTGLSYLGLLLSLRYDYSDWVLQRTLVARTISRILFFVISLAVFIRAGFVSDL